MVRPFFRRLARTAASFAAGALVAGLYGVAPTSAAQDDEDLPPDPVALRAKAESGNIPAQTQLADLYVASDDFTNAVVWYRKAAEQGDLTAQLSLASLLIAGRGAVRNPQEAAKWLRAAADRIETNKPAFGPRAIAAITTNAPPKLPTNAIIITRSTPLPVTNPALAVAKPSPPPPLPPPPVPSAPTLTRVQRAGVANAPEPTLHDVQPALRPPQEPR